MNQQNIAFSALLLPAVFYTACNKYEPIKENIKSKSNVYYEIALPDDVLVCSNLW